MKGKPSPSAAAIAARVRAYMDENQLSQTALAKLAGISKSAVGYLINYKDSGDRHAALDTVDAIAEAIGIPAVQLISPLDSARSARRLHVVAEQSAPHQSAPPADHGMDDANLLAFVIEQAESFPLFSKLSAVQRAELVAKVYHAVAKTDRQPSAAKVRRLLRSA